LLASYLVGSLSAAILVCRLLGKGDPRHQGSGNPGATNILRIHGRGPAAATLAGDVLKGLLPVLVARALGMTATTVALSGTAAFLGHLFPLFFGFRGGKGVATLIGVLCGYDWRLGAACVVTWLAVAAVTRYSSLAGLLAAGIAPPVALALERPFVYFVALTAMAAALAWRHRANIRRLRAGTESRIGWRRAASGKTSS
jgi:glycerol-3-phosphate acyltransferase PlsY